MYLDGQIAIVVSVVAISYLEREWLSGADMFQPIGMT